MARVIERLGLAGRLVRTGPVGQLFLLAFATWGVTYSRFALSPLQEALRSDLAMSDNQIAWLQGPSLALPMAFGSIPVGLLVDRFSRARILLYFGIISVMASVMTALAKNLAVLVTARCLAGFCVAGVVVASYSLAADLYGAAQRGRVNMVVGLGELGGGPAAFALGGVLLTLRSTGTEEWRWAVFWMSAPLLLVAAAMLALREPQRVGAIVKNSSLRLVWPELRRYRSLLGPLLLGRIMIYVADGAVGVWAAPTLSRRFGISPDRVGTILAETLLISGVLGPILGGPLADLCQRKGGPRRLMSVLAILAFLSVPGSLFAVMPGVASMWIVLTIFLTLGYINGCGALTLGTIVLPAELRGLYVAVTITIGALFFVGIAPLIVSGVSRLLGGPIMIGNALAIVCATASLLGAAAFALGGQYFPTHRGYEGGSDERGKTNIVGNGARAEIFPRH